MQQQRSHFTNMSFASDSPTLRRQRDWVALSSSIVERGEKLLKAVRSRCNGEKSVRDSHVTVLRIARVWTWRSFNGICKSFWMVRWSLMNASYALHHHVIPLRTHIQLSSVIISQLLSPRFPRFSHYTEDRAESFMNWNEDTLDSRTGKGKKKARHLIICRHRSIT